MVTFNWFKKEKERSRAHQEESRRKPAEVVSARAAEADTAEAKQSAGASSMKEEAARATGDAHKVLIRPVITEKSTRANAHNTYMFEVSPDANKIQVRNAVEQSFKVRVTRVHMMIQHGKRKNFGRVRGTRKHWKKAIVTVAKGQAITLHSAV